MRLNYIDNCDCLEGLQGIPDGSVDLIVTDPPYGTMRGGGKTKEARYGSHEWDTSVPAGILFPELARVLRPRGRMIVFAMEPLSSEYITEKYPLLSFLYKLYWRKNSPAMTLGAKKNPVSYIEEILVFGRNDNPPQFDAEKLHPLRAYFQEEREKCGLSAGEFRKLLGSGMGSHYFTQGEQFIIPTRENYEKLQSTGYFERPFSEILDIDRRYKLSKQDDRNRALREYGEKFPTVFNLPDGAKSKSNVLDFAKDTPSLHPTQKPIKLIEDLTATYSRPGDTVLDPFMGSGTTAVAAIETGRNYIGFELNPEYHAIAQKRIADTVDDLLGAEA